MVITVVENNSFAVFDVEQIKSKRNINGRVEYLIKWTGYEDEQNDTWGPLENLYCPELLMEFETIPLVLKVGYHIGEDGSVPEHIIGVIKHQETGKMMALLSYEDGVMEFIPTELLLLNNKTANVC
ncbi:hypothetical protein niasHT_012424 [Heterodera trifolii]|uniref:Chromo domain-containing protein n=1 Tax=Heterodera trifolii TaxID=157864 RepID=A0ABD2LAV0_9BILA